MNLQDKAAYEKRMQWFTHDRFGLFIHWGLYAIPARGEWVRCFERITVEDYQPYFDEFDPVDYNPREWARIAKEAGMKYAVMTAKHHDGFCLFDSALTDYKSTNTKCKRDLVREYLDAFRAEGLKVGLYYSLLDWHHPDYPHYGDDQHPMRDNPAYKDVKHDFDRYLDYMHGQVKELCTQYGKLDILWFDFSYGEMRGEKWRATELMQMVRTHQPDIIVDNRLMGDGADKGLMSDDPSPCAGDFLSPEQIIPPAGLRKPNGAPVCWEACLTMNNHWGYAEFDKDFYTPLMIVRKLVECVSKGGNMLLNVGPDARGNFPRESVVNLKAVGEWMRKNGESLYGCGYTDQPKPDYGRLTYDGEKRLYVHVMEPTIGPIYLSGIKKEQIKRVRLLSSGAELRVNIGWNLEAYPDYTFIRLDGAGAASYTLPDPIDTVVMIELK